MIEVKNLTKKYGSHLAVDNISFTVEDGEILGFLGPNGAGKSTTMNILTGYISATSGSCSINGYDILADSSEAKKRLGYLPEQPPLYLDMTVKEYLNFVYDLRKVKMPRGPHLEEICRLVKIKDVYHRLIKYLSKGYRQRVGIAQALVGNPRVLILDEPTVGLDPKQIIEIRNLIRNLGKTHTVIVSSHILSEIQAVCSRVIVINKGRIIADDTPENLSENLSNDHSLSLTVDAPKDKFLDALKIVPGVKSAQYIRTVNDDINVFVVDPIMGYDIRRGIFDVMSAGNWPILELKSNQLTLEDIFLRLTDENSNTKLLEKALNGNKDTASTIVKEDNTNESDN